MPFSTISDINKFGTRHEASSTMFERNSYLQNSEGSLIYPISLADMYVRCVLAGKKVRMFYSPTHMAEFQAFFDILTNDNDSDDEQ
jgi:hypothetical protein